MFKTYNVAESFWQMNLFFTMQVHRSLSTLSYAAATQTDDEDEEEVTDRRPALDRRSAA